MTSDDPASFRPEKFKNHLEQVKNYDRPIKSRFCCKISADPEIFFPSIQLWGPPIEHMWEGMGRGFIWICGDSGIGTGK